MIEVMVRRVFLFWLMFVLKFVSFKRILNKNLVVLLDILIVKEVNV